MAISEEELERRVKQLRERKRTAGPDHPIYHGGLQITCVHKPDGKPQRAGGMVTYPEDF